MQKRKQLNLQTPQTPMNWLTIINDCLPRLAIPVGPRFQADVPDWTGPLNEEYRCSGDSELDTSRWLGTRIWPIKGRSTETKPDMIGKGRPDFCLCVSPGSIECVKHHITDKRIRLQFDLGPAFWNWKFDEMGGEVSMLWTLQEQRSFEYLVKMNPISQGKSFMKPALECFPSKRKEIIVSYYFNVFVPRRISIQTRSGCKVVYSDDEEAGEVLNSKDSRKRFRAESVTQNSSKYAKTRYLTGRR